LHKKAPGMQKVYTFVLPALLLLVTGSAAFANTDPVAVDDTMTALRGQTTTTLDGGFTSVLDNDTDPEEDAITVFSVETDPVHGVLNLNADGTFSYNHDGTFNLSDSFQYRICDDGDPVQCTETGSDGTVHISIDLGDDGICSSPGIAIPDGDPVTGVTDTISAVDSDFIGDLDIVLLIEHSYVGDITATVSHDGVSVDLLARPGLPAVGEFGCGEADIDAVFDDEATASAEDTCRAQKPAIFGRVNLAPNGVLSDFDNQDFLGSWDLQVTDSEDGDTGSLLRWCLIPILGEVPNVKPTAVDDTMTAARGQITTVLDDGISSVLANDFDAGGGDTLTVETTPVELPRSGTLTLNADGTFSYDHDGSTTISDQFVYRVCDNGTPIECDDGRVEIFIDPGAGAYCSAPNAAIPDGSSSISDTISVADAGDLVEMDVVVYIEHLWVGDLDVALTHDDATTVQLLDRPGTILDPPDDFGCDGDDVDAIFDDDAGTAAEDVCAAAVPTIDGTFSPAGSLTGFIAETITGDWRLDVADRQADDAGTFKRWCLLPTLGTPPNTAPDALDDAIEVDKGGTATELVGGASSVLANDSDGEGDNLAVTTTPVEAPAHGVLGLNADGTFSYTHDNGYTTRDRFIYQVCDDGDPVECSQATVTIDVDLSVDPLCKRPEAAIPDGNAFTGVTDSISFPDPGAVADVNLLLHIDHSFVGDLRAVLTHNATEVILLDRPGEPADPAGCGGDNVDALFDDEGAIPAEDMCSTADPVIFGPVTPTQALSGYDTANVQGSWSLTVFDVASGDTGALVQWCVLPVSEANRAPTADSQGVVTDEDTALAVTLTGDDLDFDPLEFIIQDSPDNGALSGTLPDLTYTPEGDFFGLDSFTFTTFDGTLNSALATITISVIGENDAPVANSDAVSTAEETPVDITLTGSDVDGNPLTFNIVTPPANGSLGGAVPTINYTPDADFNGEDSFEFEAFDGSLVSAPATVTINVGALPEEIHSDGFEDP
jgi:subtilisin-like proprotein convertase family protein